MEVNYNSVIKRIAKPLEEGYSPKIILFDFYTYGLPDESSDIDLLIVKKADNNRRIDRFHISPLVLTGDETKERLQAGDDFILTKGKSLYKKKLVRNEEMETETRAFEKYRLLQKHPMKRETPTSMKWNSSPREQTQ